MAANLQIVTVAVFQPALAGAQHVYAIEYSEISHQARKIIKKNGLEDRITLISKRVESLDEDDYQVDIIVSEWMGYFLLYEGMLSSVLYARDNFLKADGLMFPNRACLFVQGVRSDVCEKERLEFWDEVYGIDMSSMKQLSLKEVVIETVCAEQLRTDECKVLEIDLEKVLATELDFVAPFRLVAEQRANLNALVAWFECHFDHCAEPIALTTSPRSAPTHWKQSLMLLEKPVTVEKGQVVFGQIAVARARKNRRDLDIKIGIRRDKEDSAFEISQCFQLH